MIQHFAFSAKTLHKWKSKILSYQHKTFLTECTPFVINPNPTENPLKTLHAYASCDAHYFSGIAIVTTSVKGCRA